VEVYTRDNYKYRNDGDGRSVDDQLKTRLLLKNIAGNKLLNRRSLLSPNALNGGTAESDPRDGGQRGGGTAMPSAPKTTTAADMYENGGNQVNVPKQNRRASSIDDVVLLNATNQDYQGCPQDFKFLQEADPGAGRGERPGLEAANFGAKALEESLASQDWLGASGNCPNGPRKVLNTSVKGQARKTDYQRLNPHRDDLNSSLQQLQKNNDQDYQDANSANG
jgi:hypothetical protein